MDLLRKVQSKINGSYFIMEKTKTFFGFSIIPNIITEKWDYYCYKLSNFTKYMLHGHFD